MLAGSCERLREIGDGTAQFVVFQFKEHGHQARAMVGKRHVDEDGVSLRSLEVHRKKYFRATGSGLTVLHDPNRSPVHLTVHTRDTRVLSLECKDGDAWRMEIETYQSGRWESRLKAMGIRAHCLSAVDPG